MFDIPSWLAGVSALGILAIIGLVVAAESGLLVGLVLPGDTLLITAGLLAAQDKISLAWVVIVIFIGAVVGDNVGYFFGNKTGPRVFTKSDGFFFRSEYLEKARAFYARYGGKTVTIARFIPYARTFAPLVAGAAKMQRLKFILYDMAGALAWSVSFVLLGYWLGLEANKFIGRYLGWVVIISLAFVFSPTIIYFFKHRRVQQFFVRKIKWLIGLFRFRRNPDQ